MEMQEYQQKASRTAAAPDMALRPDMFNTHSKLAYEMVNLIVNGQQGDIIKRALFYKESLARLGERTTTFKDNAVELYEATKAVEPTRQFTEQQIRVAHAAFGWMSEAAEVLEEVVRSFLENRPMDLTNLGEEGGDNMWYTAELFNQIGTDFNKEGAKNIAKLEKRFPEKFSEEHALNRDLGAERKVLEA